MATPIYFVSAKKRDLAPIYVRLSAGRKVDLIVKTGLIVDPKCWSNTTQSIKQRIRTPDDDALIKKLKGLKDHIEREFKNRFGEYSKEWLNDVVYQFHNNKSIGAKTLNDFIDLFIKDSECGERKNKDAMDLAPGTIKAWKGFQRIFGEYQGIYSDKRIEWYKENDIPLRPYKPVDFDGITIDFYNSFVSYLSDMGYKRNTMGRFIKELKMFMLKSIEDGLHNNRQFEYSAFKGINSESFAVYLTKTELEKITNLDLTTAPNEKHEYSAWTNNELDKARDAFIVMCETALRISDYKKVDVSIRTNEKGVKMLYITQTKTGGSIVIPVSARLNKILLKYDNKLPRLPDQYINKRIKVVARICGIDEMQTFPEEKYGKRYDVTKPKWELISCHSGRRTACSLWYLAGIPTISIMQITGHKTEKIFLHYIKVTPEENAEKLSLHPYFTGLAIAN